MSEKWRGEGILEGQRKEKTSLKSKWDSAHCKEGKKKMIGQNMG